MTSPYFLKLNSFLPLSLASSSSAAKLKPTPSFSLSKSIQYKKRIYSKTEEKIPHIVALLIH